MSHCLKDINTLKCYSFIICTSACITVTLKVKFVSLTESAQVLIKKNHYIDHAPFHRHIKKLRSLVTVTLQGHVRSKVMVPNEK